MNTGVNFHFDNFCDNDITHTKDLVTVDSEENLELFLGQLKKRIPFYKRIMDLFFAITALLITLPIIIIAACLLGIESLKEPILEKSKRTGMGYKIFDLYQFRNSLPSKKLKKNILSNYQTEISNYEKTIYESSSIITSLNKKQENEINKNKLIENHNYKGLNIERKETVLGKLLRKSKILYLPQLLNVLKGEMSIVGNRPLTLSEAKKLTTNKFASRFIAPVGITGLCQVINSTHIVTPRVKINLEIDYAKNYSFMLDLEILIKSIPKIFSSSETKFV